MRGKNKKIMHEKVRTNHINQAARLCKVAIGQPQASSFLQPGARKIGIYPIK